MLFSSLMVDKSTNIHTLVYKEYEGIDGIYWKFLSNGELVYIKRIEGVGWGLLLNGDYVLFDEVYDALEFFDVQIGAKRGVGLFTHS